MAQHPMLRTNGYAVSRNLHPRLVNVDRLRSIGRDTRKHPPAHIRKLKASIEQYGFVLPIVIDELHRVVAGWGLVLAARNLGLTQVPAVTLSGLREAELRTLRLALNRLGEDSRWDREALALEFSDIFELEPEADLQISGFEIEEIEELLDSNETDQEPELRVLANDAELVTRPGDLWVLGLHKVLCADARDPESYDRLLGGEKAQMVFADLAPIDSTAIVPIGTDLAGLDLGYCSYGRMSRQEYETFLQASLGQAVMHSADGAVHFVCTNWRSLCQLLAASKELYSEMLSLCVWNKSQSTLGRFYKSKHELLLVYKVGTATPINN